MAGDLVTGACGEKRKQVEPEAAGPQPQRPSPFSCLSLSPLTAQSHNALPTFLSQAISPLARASTSRLGGLRCGQHTHSHPMAPTPTSVSQLTPQLGLSRSPGQSSPKAPGNSSSQLLGLSLDRLLTAQYTPMPHHGSQGDPGKARLPCCPQPDYPV